MQIAGIIAEYDPLHAGHAWQIRRAKELGAQGVVCVMSPGVVQRGGFSILPAGVRVKAALLAGADLVLTLPAPYAAASAEQFAAAGVALLAGLGCVDTLVFGSETGEAAPLLEAARRLADPQLPALLHRQLEKGLPFAAARAAALEQLHPGCAEVLARPNDLLGVEYCRAILAQKAPLTPLAVLRQGAGHGGAPAQGFASASWLRSRTGGSDRANGAQAVEGWADYVPSACMELYRTAAGEGLLLDRRAADIAILSRLRGLRPADLENIRGVREGLEYRLLTAAGRAGSLEELYTAMKCKRYAHARLRRLALDAALGVEADLPALPPYLHLAGMGPKGREILAMAKPALPLDSRLAKLEKTGPAAAKVAALHAAAEDLSALCRQRPQPAGSAYTRPLIRL